MAAQFWLVALAVLAGAQPQPGEEAVELALPGPRPILSAPLDDRRASDVLLNRVNLAESGRLLTLGREATTQASAADLPLSPDPETGAARSLPGLLLPDGRSHLIFPVPERFSLQEGTLEVTWQPRSEPEEFGALFASDTDTAFEAFFAEGRLHFRVAGGQVSAAHKPEPGGRHRYRFLWQRPAGGTATLGRPASRRLRGALPQPRGGRAGKTSGAGWRAIFIDGRLAAEDSGGAWEEVAVGKKLLFNARANLAFPGRGGAPGLYARIVIYDRALAPEEPPTAEAEPAPETAPAEEAPGPEEDRAEEPAPQ